MLSNSKNVEDDLFALASGPDPRVSSNSSCVVNGVRFCTAERDKYKKTQNFGLSCPAVHGNGVIDYFGKLIDIIELQYHNKNDGTKRSVVLFKCEWYKLDGKKTAMKDDGFYRSINTESFWYKKKCFILATQARQVFYLPDNKHDQN
jgi:hypothetical protein